MIAERRQRCSVQLQRHTEAVIYRGVEHKVVRSWDPRPEASCVCVVVVIDVGDDFGEPYDAAPVRVFVGSSGHAEGRLLLDSGSPIFSWFSWRSCKPWDPWFPWFPALTSFTNESHIPRVPLHSPLRAAAAAPRLSWLSFLSSLSVTTVSAGQPGNTWHPRHPCCWAGVLGNQQGYS